MRYGLIFTMLFLSCVVTAQVNNIYRSGGISQTVGAPTFRPGASGNIVAIDTVTGIWYISRDRNSVNWQSMGQRIEQSTGCAAPAYVPDKMNSDLVINSCATPQMYYHTGGGTWVCLTCASSGSITTDATLAGDGTGGTPLKIAQQGALTSQGLEWTGSTWAPSWGNPYTFVTANSSVTADYNMVLIGTLTADITLGLPTCNAANDKKVFEFKKNGNDVFGATIDPSGGELFYDGAATKEIFSPLNLNCACRFSGSTGVWFFTY